MKKSLILGFAVLGLALAGCNNAATPASEQKASEEPAATAATGSIVYFNIDKVMDGYDMANDLRSVMETKVNGIQSEVDRRGKKLEKDYNDFNQKVEKGLMTRSVAEVQGQKLQQQQQDYMQYAQRKQAEIAEEQQVTLNQIADAINSFVIKFNEEHNYALILATSGDILPAPVVTGDPALDITEALLQGLNDEYIKTKAANKEDK